MFSPPTVTWPTLTVCLMCLFPLLHRLNRCLEINDKIHKEETIINNVPSMCFLKRILFTFCGFT